MSIFGLRANYAFLFPNPLWLFTFYVYYTVSKKKKKKAKKNDKWKQNIKNQL